MRLPFRKSTALLGHQEETVIHLTQAGVDKIQRELARLHAERPALAEEVNRTSQYGDFSENAEYQEAKYQLRRALSRIDVLEDRLKRVVVIEDGADDTERVRIGSTVRVHVGEKSRVYTIVGPQETNPLKGRISYASPLGAALLNQSVGAHVHVATPDGTPLDYVIEEIT